MTTQPQASDTDAESRDRGRQYSDWEIEKLAELAATAVQPTGIAFGPDVSEEEIRQAEREEQERKRAAMEDFRAIIKQRDDKIYWDWNDRTGNAETARQTFIRSIVLLLVVLAVVMMPIIAILTELDPDSFGTYIAPITGIAGTVVGFWFGTIERKSSQTT